MGTIAIAGFVASYLLGLLIVGVTVSETWSGADSTPMVECRHAPDRPQDAQVLEHEVRYLPLQIMCRTSDGRLFSSSVIPLWLNLTFATSFAVTVALTATRFARTVRRTDDKASSAGQAP